MRIHSVLFGEGKIYKRFASVLATSMERNSPHTPFLIHSISGYDKELVAKCGRGVSGHEVINALKTKYHNDLVQNTKNGELIGLFDLDLLVLKDLSCIENEEFDLAHTVRNEVSRINSGVIFIRVSDKIKNWYQRWLENVEYLLRHNTLRKELHQKNAGINQSSLVMLLEQPHELKIKELPGLIWNCTPVDYPNFGEQTKIVHMLNQTKKEIIGMAHSRAKNVNQIVKLWKNFENLSMKEKV